MSAPGDAPRLAVVGRVNKGKSSVVATLAEDETVRIDPRPGTTTEVREYPVLVDGRTLLVLLDTPGFEDAPRALAWLRAGGEVPADERPARVAALVRAHQGTGELVEERRLLAPILAGASVLYVVDGTKPYRPNYEAEMEILRWTGQPGMALVNRIGEGDHGAAWHRALGQYFRIVRDFDAFAAGFDERIALLRAFRELRPEWRPALDAAISAISADRRRRRLEAAAAIADLLAEGLSHAEEVAVEREQDLEAERDRLERGFHDALRRLEERERRRVERLYLHGGAAFREGDLARPIFGQDLFAEETWRLLGLAPGQLVAASAVAGAALGGTLDALVGGASFMAGALVGGALGGGTALWGVGRRFVRARALGAPGWAGILTGAQRAWEGAPRFRIGPHGGPNFPWVLLDRALLHFDAVVRRTHARRGPLAVDDDGTRAGIVSGFAREERRALERIFQELRARPGDPPREAAGALERALGRVLARIDPVEDEARAG